MNPLDMIDVEIEAEAVGDQYRIYVDAGDFGEARIYVKKWVMDAALDEAEATIEQGAKAWSDVFDQLKEELND